MKLNLLFGGKLSVLHEEWPNLGMTDYSDLTIVPILDSTTKLHTPGVHTPNFMRLF